MSGGNGFTRKPTLQWSDVGTETVILNREERELLRLNEVAGFIWKQLDGRRSALEIAHAVCETFRADAQSALRDVELFLNRLKTLELVVEQHKAIGCDPS